jgi:hypothetical protein
LHPFIVVPPVHVLFEHTWPDVHAWKHEPQFDVSFARFTQPPPHIARPFVQVPHVEFTHAMPVPQVKPQEPQLFGSVAVFTHTPLHIGPLGQAHSTPFWQIWPLAHACPHEPQFWTVVTSVHTPPHSICVVDGQTHALFVHC